jgi:transposase
MHRYELSDGQWDQIQDLFPSGDRGRGRPRRDDRD